jgi:hypothetical protein
VFFRFDEDKDVEKIFDDPCFYVFRGIAVDVEDFPFLAESLIIVRPKQMFQ